MTLAAHLIGTSFGLVSTRIRNQQSTTLVGAHSSTCAAAVAKWNSQVTINGKFGRFIAPCEFPVLFGQRGVEANRVVYSHNKTPENSKT